MKVSTTCTLPTPLAGLGASAPLPPTQAVAEIGHKVVGGGVFSTGATLDHFHVTHSNESGGSAVDTSDCGLPGRLAC